MYSLSPAYNYAYSLLGGADDWEFLRLLVHSAETKVKRYTKRKELCEGLVCIVGEIAADRYRAFKAGEGNTPQFVSSITDGEQSVTFKVPKNLDNSIAELTESEKKMLNEWRRLF